MVVIKSTSLHWNVNIPGIDIIVLRIDRMATALVKHKINNQTLVELPGI